MTKSRFAKAGNNPIHKNKSIEVSAIVASFVLEVLQLTEVSPRMLFTDGNIMLSSNVRSRDRFVVATRGVLEQLRRDLCLDEAMVGVICIKV